MKPSLRTIALLLIAPVLITSCVKVQVVQPASPIAGTWQLTDAAEGDAYGWTSLYTGLETGVFVMTNEGIAQYTDAGLNLQGNWYLTAASGGYFDEFGSYVNGPHQQLQMHLSDYYSHNTIDLSFDNVTFYGNQFVATYFNGNLIERYTFTRY